MKNKFSAAAYSWTGCHRTADMFPKSSSLQQVKIITENKYLLPGYMISSSTRKKEWQCWQIPDQWTINWKLFRTETNILDSFMAEKNESGSKE
jgi:hypothetical protein